MSFLDELEKQIKRAAAYPTATTSTPERFLATHGPRLLAAVRLAEAINSVHDTDLWGNSNNVAEALEAYQAALAGKGEA